LKAIPNVYDTRQYLDQVKEMLDCIEGQINAFVEALYQAYLQDNLIFLIGNGGSAANASHFGQDLNKGTLAHMATVKRFRAISLTDNTSFITALANDEGYESIFVEQLMNLSGPTDVLIAISGSGNSRNVLKAVEYATNHGMTTIGVSGFDGGVLRNMAGVNIHVPSHDMGLVEAVHGVIFHLAISQLKQRVEQSAA